jgi:hypothetical protein
MKMAIFGWPPGGGLSYFIKAHQRQGIKGFHRAVVKLDF